MGVLLILLFISIPNWVVIFILSFQGSTDDSILHSEVVILIYSGVLQ